MKMKISFLGGKQAGCIGLLTLKAINCEILSAVPYDLNVKILAETLEIPIFSSVHNEQFIDIVKKSDLLISVHGREIVPKEIINLPSIGSINVHPCLYKYKGANPIQRMLNDNNSKARIGIKASIGIHYMTEKVDEGDIIIENFITTNGKNVLEVYNDLYPYYSKTIIEAIRIIKENVIKRLE